MSERWVEILVTREVREMVKQMKGKLSYNEFFRKLYECQNGVEF